MGLAWQQGPLAAGAIGRFLVPDPLPERPLEDDRIVGHAADPYHRIDIRKASRHLVVRHGDRVIADTTRPLGA